MLHRLANLFRVGRVTLIDDAGPVRRMQIDEGDLGAFGGRRVVDNVPHYAHFGLISLPPIGSEIVLAAPAGDRTQSIAIGSNHRDSRPTGMQPGDSGIYDVRGAKVTLTENGLLIDAAGKDVTIQNATNVTISASDKITLDTPILDITGDVVSRSSGTSVSLNALHDAYAAHKHTGVSTGSGSTGLTDHTA